jgi:N-acetylneuraminic acid mutarotase
LNRKVTIVVTLFAVFLVFSAFQAFFALATTEDSWATKEPLPIPSRSIVGVNDKIYAIAGTGDFANVSYSYNAVLEYDPALDTWTAKKTTPTAKGSVATAVYQNKIYVFGESDGLNQVYDPATDTWENRTSMPTLRTQFEANMVNGKIYLIGGHIGGEGSPTDVNEVYDPANDSWTTKAAMPFGVYSYASAVVDNKIYFMGGSGQDTHNLNQIYDADTDTWSFGTPAPIPVDSAVAGATSGVMAPKRIYVIGGIDRSADGISTNRVYNPQNDSWTVGASMPTARFQLDMTVLNDQLYVVGGLPSFTYFTYCREFEQYTPFGYGAAPPVIDVASPVNQAYNASSVSLDFSLNKPAVWMGYSLDGQDNVTINGNTTMEGLSNGLHNVTVYARDYLDNTGASETVSFIVESPFPIALVAVSTASAIIIGIGLLVYFKKRKR